MLEASCHCGAVRLTVPRRPRTLLNCNCSICRRYSGLWTYYRAGDVRIRGRASLASYIWGDRCIRHYWCRHCGCVTHWSLVKATKTSRMGVNARNLDPEAIKDVRIRRFDGAVTWKFID